MYHYTDGGLRHVWLRNGYEMHETPHGKAVSFQDGDGLASGYPMSLPSLAKLLGVDGQTVARWEKSGKVPKWADKLVRLLYTAHAGSHEAIQNVAARINDVDRQVLRTSPWRRAARDGRLWFRQPHDSMTNTTVIDATPLLVGNSG